MYNTSFSFSSQKWRVLTVIKREGGRLERGDCAAQKNCSLQAQFKFISSLGTVVRPLDKVGRRGIGFPHLERISYLFFVTHITT